MVVLLLWKKFITSIIILHGRHAVFLLRHYIRLTDRAVKIKADIKDQKPIPFFLLECYEILNAVCNGIVKKRAGRQNAR